MSIQIQFGDHLLETEIDRLALQDLLNSKVTELSSLIIASVKEVTLSEVRDSITTGDLNRANQREGYLQALEDLEDFFKLQLPLSLKLEDKSEVI